MLQIEIIFTELSAKKNQILDSMKRSSGMEKKVWLAIVSAANTLDATITTEEWDAYRIKHMIPDYGHEICPKFHPLAVGLDDLVHPAKGCYIGQEVLARMVSRKSKEENSFSKTENHLMKMI